MLAVVTASEARSLDEDLAPLVAALQAQAIAHEVVDWDDRSVDWARFASVLIRSPWDYTDRLPEFLDWATAVAARCQLLNPLPILRWNTHKAYLLELAGRGIAVVPTQCVRVGEALPALPEGEIVVKPAVGAGSRGARRFRDDPAGARAHALALLAEQRDVLIQPYLARVDAAGETGLLYFNGVYSHAIRKGPLLAPNADATALLFAPEEIRARQPTADEFELAERILAALPETPLYARVDLLRAADGSPVLLELELTEPSLFFATAPGSVEVFVRALKQRMA